MVVGFSESGGTTDGGLETCPDHLIHMKPNEDRNNTIFCNVAAKVKISRSHTGLKEKVNRCQKPVHLCVWILEHFTTPGAKVIDIFSGVGKFYFII